MPIERDQAIVLRLTDYSETSQIATLFAADAGLLRLIAKGIKRGTSKRFATGMDLLELGEVNYAPPRGDATLATLTDWTQRDTFSGLRKNLAGLYAGLYAAELVSSLTEERDPHPELFEALHGLLAGLADGGQIALKISRFQYRLLDAIGYRPTLDRCVSCDRPAAPNATLYFSSAAGGIVCRDCEMHYVEKRPLRRGLIGAKREARDASAWFELLDYHLCNIAGHGFKSTSQLARQLARLAEGA